MGSGYVLDTTTQLFSQRASFIFQQGVTAPIPTYNGLTVSAGDINSAGQVAGYTYTVDTATGNMAYQRAIRRGANGQVTDLGTLGGSRARAAAINEAGQIAGSSRLAGSTLSHAFLYSAGQMFDLGAPAGWSSSGTAINNSGTVAGTLMSQATGDTHAAIFSQGQILDIGTLGSGVSTRAINDHGQVVGNTATADEITTYHPFLYDGGVLRDLGSFAGKAITTANAINNHGQIVGTAANFNAFDNEGFLWGNGQMRDINALLDPARAPGWAITGVYAINDRGQIAGDGILNGVRQAVLLTPVPELPVSVLLAAGLAALLLRSRRRVLPA